MPGLGAENAPVAGGNEWARDFRTTHWSVVLLAGQNQSPQSAEALEKLCRTYWYPLYAFVRKRGYDAHEAQDLTQAFFARFLEKNYVSEANAQRGKFRTFLLVSLSHFLANEWDRAQAKKRGGGCTIISFDDQDAEDRYRHEPVNEMTAEKIYERRWAETVLELVLNRLEQEFDGSAKEKRFEELKGFLIGNAASASYAVVGEKLGLSEQAVKSAVHRLRQRYRELLYAEIAHTVSSPSEVQEELRYLLGALTD